MLCPRLTVVRTAPCTVLTDACDYGDNLYMVVQGVLQYFVGQTSASPAVARVSAEDTNDAVVARQQQAQSQRSYACAGLMTVGDSFGSICEEVCSVAREERTGSLAAGDSYLSSPVSGCMWARNHSELQCAHSCTQSLLIVTLINAHPVLQLPMRISGSYSVRAAPSGVAVCLVLSKEVLLSVLAKVAQLEIPAQHLPSADTFLTSVQLESVCDHDPADPVQLAQQQTEESQTDGLKPSEQIAPLPLAINTTHESEVCCRMS